jgi:PhnB protein
MINDLYPKLVVADADQAIDFYTKTLGATQKVRFVDDSGRVVHAELDLDGSVIALAQAVNEWGWSAPTTVGGSPVLLLLTSSDPDSTAERMVQHGAEVDIPIENRPYGKREGRVKDPYGHMWIISGEPK